MHVHTVFFWLHSSIDDAAREQFEGELKELTRDPNIRASHVGTPADTDRGVVDSSYDYGMVLCFDDRAGHDRYQVGEPHARFVEVCSSMWDRVQVYDIHEAP